MADNLVNLNAWKTQFLKEHVQNLSSPEGGDFLSSETVVLISGPAKPTNDWLSKSVPIALVQNAQVAQQKNLQQIFEIGSRRPYFIPGRTFISCAIARVLFDGPSLMYALYMKEVTDNNELTSLSATDWPISDDISDLERPAKPFTTTSASNPTLGTLSETNPGLFFINLASSFFNKPHGLGFILYDAEQEPYGGFYLQECYIQSHSFSVAAQQTILVENVSIRATDMFPFSAQEL